MSKRKVVTADKAALQPPPANSNFTPIKQRTRRAYISEELRNAIFSGRLTPGTKIVESRLAEQFQVSRGPLREAIRELVEEGLLIQKPYSETHVANVNLGLLEETYSVRLVLEQRAFKLCWDRRDQRFRDEFIHRHDVLVDAVNRQDLLGEINAEIALHSWPYEFSGNSVLIDMWKQISQRFRLCFFLYQQVYEPKYDFAEAHKRYLRCALGKSLDAMNLEIENHLDAGLAAARLYFRRLESDPTEKTE